MGRDSKELCATFCLEIINFTLHLNQRCISGTEDGNTQVVQYF